MIGRKNMMRIESFSVLVSHSMKISDPLISMVFPWGSYRSYYNGQDIEYLLKKVRIRGKFNVFLTPCVIACPVFKAMLQTNMEEKREGIIVTGW